MRYTKLSILFYEDFFLRVRSSFTSKGWLRCYALSILFYEDFFLRGRNPQSSCELANFLSILFYEDFFLREVFNQLQVQRGTQLFSFNPLLWGFLFARTTNNVQTTNKYITRKSFNPLLWGFLFASQVMTQLSTITMLTAMTFNPLLWGFLFARRRTLNIISQSLGQKDRFQSSFMRISFCEEGVPPQPRIVYPLSILFYEDFFLRGFWF